MPVGGGAAAVARQRSKHTLHQRGPRSPRGGWPRGDNGRRHRAAASEALTGIERTRTHTHTASPGVVAGWAAATQWRGWASAHACLPTPTRCLCLGWQSSQRSRRRHQWVSRSWGSSASSSSSCSSRSTTSSWACHKFCRFLLLSVYFWRPAPAPIDYNHLEHSHLIAVFLAFVPH